MAICVKTTKQIFLEILIEPFLLEGMVYLRKVIWTSESVNIPEHKKRCTGDTRYK